MTRLVPPLASFGRLRPIRSAAACALALAGLAVLSAAPRQNARADEPPPAAPFDVNADGVEDWGYTHPTLGHEPPQPGYVAVFSGADDTMLWFAVGEHGNDAFGGSSAVVADVDGDGAPDVLVAAPLRAQENPAFLGRAHVLSGATGEFLRAHEGDPGEWFALEVSATVDRDLDGVADYCVYGAAMDELERRVFRKSVYSGATGAPLYSLSILSSDFEGGLTPGDVNADGVVDAGDVAQVVGSIGETGEDLPEDLSQNEVVDSPDVSITLANVGSTRVAPVDADGETWPDIVHQMTSFCRDQVINFDGGCPGGSNGSGDGDNDNTGGQNPGDTTNGGDGPDTHVGRPLQGGARPGSGSDCDCGWPLAELNVPNFVAAGAAGAVTVTHPPGCSLPGGSDGFDVQFTTGHDLIASGAPLAFTAGPEAGVVFVRALWKCRGSVRAERTDHFEIAKFDLDIDSDNTNDLEMPDRDSAEEAEEDAEPDDDHPGKVILVNSWDTDGDGIEDLIDGYDWNPLLEQDDVIDGGRFTPLILEAASVPDSALLALSYDAADPLAITLGDSGWETEGSLRLWLRDAGEPRDRRSVLDGGDFVPPGEYEMSELGLGGGDEITLFVEAVNPSAEVADKSISVAMDLNRDGEWVTTDRVRITAVRVDLLGRVEDEAQGMRMPFLVATNLYDAATPPESEVIAQNHRAFFLKFRVRDPRDLEGAPFTIGGEVLPLLEAGAQWETGEFWIDAPPHFDQPGMSAESTTRQHLTLQGDSFDWEYNSNGTVKLLPVPLNDPGDAVMAELALTIQAELEADVHQEWLQRYAATDSAPFGKEMHRRATEALQGRDQWAADIYVRQATREVLSIGSPPAGPSTGITQVDVARLKPGSQLQVGDTFGPHVVERIYDIKTGVDDAVDIDQRNRLTALMDGQRPMYVRPTRRYTPSAGWHPHPKSGGLFAALSVVAIAPQALAIIQPDDVQLDLLARNVVTTSIQWAHAQAGPDPALAFGAAHDFAQALAAFINERSGGDYTAEVTGITIIIEANRQRAERLALE